MLSNVINTIALLIIVVLSVIPTIYGSSMGDDAFYLTDSLVHRAINVIYSILLIGYVWVTYSPKRVKLLSIIASIITLIYFSMFIYTLIDQVPTHDLKRELIYHEF